MDTLDTASMQLLAELKLIFPEIPEEIIRKTIIESAKDKEACIKLLIRINEDRLFTSKSLIRDKFNKLGFSEMDEHDESKERFDSELDIFIPEESTNLNYKFLLDEEKKSLNMKDGILSLLPDVSKNADKMSANQTTHNKSATQSAPVLPNAFHPFGLTDNGNVLPTIGQTEQQPNSDIARLINKNNALSKDTLKWNNSINELVAELQPSMQFSHQNFSRGYSYPLPDPHALGLRNIPYPQSNLYYYNRLKDFSTPLYVTVTSSPHLMNPSYITSHPSTSLLPSSPNVQRRHSPVPSHVTSSYSPPLSSVLPPSTRSPISPFSYPSPICPPHQQVSTNISSHQSTTTSSSNLHFAYQHITEEKLKERIVLKNTSQSTAHYQPTYELFPHQEFTSRTYSPSFTSTLVDPFNPEFTHPLPSFLPKASHSKPEGNNETAYVTALLSYQMNNFQLMMNELSKMKNLRYTLRMDVNSREQKLSQIRHQQQFPNMEQIQKLKEEIIKLRVERDCLKMELDFHSKRQESQNTIVESFYENIFTGPIVPVSASTNSTAPVQNSFAEHRDEEDQSNKWNCSKCTYANHPDLIDCEMCESPRVMIMPD